MKSIFNHHSLGAALALLSLLAAACSDNDTIPDVDAAVTPSSISLNIPDEYAKLVYTDNTGADVLPLIVGETVQLDYTLTPSDVTFSGANWSSSDVTVATVSDGLVEALSERGLGYSVISVSPIGVYAGSGMTSTLKVNVADHLTQATSLTITSDADEVYEQESISLSFSLEPESVTYRTVEWSSSDESTATVDADGVVTGVSTGGTDTQKEVTITATAMDGSGVSASKQIIVKRLVDPESVTLDQTYSYTGYDCAVADHTLTIDYTTYPEDCTKSLIEWSSSDETIATVDGGVVTFNQSGNFGQVTITALCPSTGQEDAITLNLAAGLIREHFDNADNYTWYNASQSGNGTASSHELHPDEDGGYITITTYAQSSDKQRGDFKCWESKTWIYPSDYPLFAIRMQDVNDVYGYSRNINLDTSGSDLSTGTRYAGNVGGSNNKWKTKYKLSDGSCVLIYDFTTQSFATGGLFPEGNLGEFTTFQFKYADIATVTTQIQYNVWWVQTFKTEDEIKALIESEGLTIE